jgi:hypothetical protein
MVVRRSYAIFDDIGILGTGFRFPDAQYSGPDPKGDMRDRFIAARAQAFAVICVCVGMAAAAPRPAPTPASGKPDPALASQLSGKPVAAASRSHLSTTASGLDTGTVRKLYLDGDFEEAIGLLDSLLKSKARFDHYDSIFIFKHLGVMYAANYETREKGKYYMHQLLMVEPTARIMDMYASDMIYMIFKNIQDELASSRMVYERAEPHLTRNAQNGPADKSGRQEPEAPKLHSNHKALYWVGATGLVLAAGATAYLVIVNQPGQTTTTDHKLQN